MSIATKLRRAPGRATAGAFILNSGLNKFKADEDTAHQLHDLAVGAYPFLSNVKPKTFVRGLSVVEITLGGALLLPVAPPLLAGAGLAAFSGGLLGLYWRTPGLHSQGDPRPTQQGTALAKDVWMAGIALGLLIDVVVPDTERRRAIKRADRRARKAEAHAHEVDAETAERTEKAATDAAKTVSRRHKRDQVVALAGVGAETTQHQASDAWDALAKHSPEVRDAAVKHASDLRDAALKRAPEVRDTIAKHAPEIKDAVVKHAPEVRDMVMRHASDFFDIASYQAADLHKATRKQAKAARKQLKVARKHTSEAAEAMTESVRQGSEAVRQGARALTS